MTPTFLRRKQHDFDNDSLLRVPVVVVYRWRGKKWRCSEREWSRMVEPKQETEAR